MSSVGIRDLRNSLSRHLAAVREGHTVTITDHGKVIARIVPAGPTKLEQLIAEGVVTPARRPKGPARDPIDVGYSVSDLIDEQRR